MSDIYAFNTIFKSFQTIFKMKTQKALADLCWDNVTLP